MYIVFLCVFVYFSNMLYGNKIFYILNLLAYIVTSFTPVLNKFVI